MFDIISPSCCDMVISPTTTHPLHLIVPPATVVSPIPPLFHLNVVMLEPGILGLDLQNVLMASRPLAIAIAVPLRPGYHPSPRYVPVHDIRAIHAYV
jgi:hypothetical protein